MTVIDWQMSFSLVRCSSAVASQYWRHPTILVRRCDAETVGLGGSGQ